MRAADLSTVTQDITATAANPYGVIGTVFATFTYDPQHPYEVTLTVGESGWTFARDLLAEGLDDRAGLGDVEVWPSGICVTIRLFNGVDTYYLHIAAVWMLQSFLAATEQRVPRGAERIDDAAIDAGLARILGGGR